MIITNNIKDLIKALEIYRRKDTGEKSFDNYKTTSTVKDLVSSLSHGRPTVHSVYFLDPI